MTTPRKSFSRLALALGGLLAGLPAATALADEPITAADAEQKAQEYRERADSARAMGGVGYTTGQVQYNKAEATKYQALAERLESPPPPAPSPTAEHYADLVKSYRAQGGVTYKTGLLQSAEAELRTYEVTPAAAVPATQEQNPPCREPKPSVGTPYCEP